MSNHWGERPPVRGWGSVAGRSYSRRLAGQKVSSGTVDQNTAHCVSSLRRSLSGQPHSCSYIYSCMTMLPVVVWQPKSIRPLDRSTNIAVDQCSRYNSFPTEACRPAAVCPGMGSSTIGSPAPSPRGADRCSSAHQSCTPCACTLPPAEHTTPKVASACCWLLESRRRQLCAAQGGSVRCCRSSAHSTQGARRAHCINYQSVSSNHQGVVGGRTGSVFHRVLAAFADDA